MKFLNIIFSSIFALIVFTSCENETESDNSFKISSELLAFNADGGDDEVIVSGIGKWVASVDEPWLKVSPANGSGAAKCTISVDSTMANTGREATIIFVHESSIPQVVSVEQLGYGKQIKVDTSFVEVDNLGKYGERYFEVSVISNVEFDVELNADITGDKPWLACDKNSNLGSMNNARPKVTKVRFDWGINTISEVRKAEIKFVPTSSEDSDAGEATVNVEQLAAPLITDDHVGDSLAVMLIQEKLNTYSRFDTSEPMIYWEGLTLWEATDKEVKANPAMKGRIRSVSFAMISTEEVLPFELSKLKYLETLYVGSNTNVFLKYDMLLGDAIYDLQYLKNLTIFSYGIDQLEDEFVVLGDRLEKLNLSSNNFYEFPSILTKENFPHLKSLIFTGQRRFETSGLDKETRENIGFELEVTQFSDGYNKTFKNILLWDTLEELVLSYNYLWGKLPDMNVWGVDKYTEEDLLPLKDTISAAGVEKLKTIPRILPNVRRFTLNLNYFTGDLPDWILYHPNLSLWDPYTLIFNQDDYNDPNGLIPGFDNEPNSLEYYYELFPGRRPVSNY